MTDNNIRRPSSVIRHRLSVGGRRGQTMILTILALGGTILGATTIAGFLLVSQIRQANDSADSFRAIFAADTGIEWGLYRFFNPESPQAEPTLEEGAAFTVSCPPDGDCRATSTVGIRSLGTAGKSARALELSLQ